MFLILRKRLLKFLVGPNLMKAAGITTWLQFTQGQCLFCHQGLKRMAFWSLFCRWFSYYFASVWKIDTTSLHANVAVHFAQIFKIFAQKWPIFQRWGCDCISCIPIPYAYGLEGIGIIFQIEELFMDQSQAWASEGFFPGGTRVFFQIFSRWWPKVVKSVFSHSKLRKQRFLLNISKSKGKSPLPPSDAHGRRNLCIHRKSQNSSQPSSLKLWTYDCSWLPRTGGYWSDVPL